MLYIVFIEIFMLHVVDMGCMSIYWVVCWIYKLHVEYKVEMNVN